MYLRKVATSTSERPTPVFSTQKCAEPNYIATNYSVETRSSEMNILNDKLHYNGVSTQVQRRTPHGKLSSFELRKNCVENELYYDQLHYFLLQAARLFLSMRTNRHDV